MLSRRTELILACAMSALSTDLATASPTFVVDSAGQATITSCQSYVLALGLAFKRDGAFPLSTWSQLRKAEREIRTDIVAAFKKREPKAKEIEPNYDDVKAGFEGFTSGKYRLVLQNVNLQELHDVVASHTGVTTVNAVPPSFLLGAVVKDVVMSSARKIGPDKFEAGHMFMMLGIAGPMNNTRRFLILNSAVKKEDVTWKNACTEELPDEPGPYTASLTWRSLSDLELTPFGDKFNVWAIEKK